MEIDTFNEQAYISLVAFSVTKMRMVGLPNCQRFFLKPFCEHEFLNVSTCVSRGGELGIYFLEEFVNRYCAIPLAKITYGLPYQYAKIEYEESSEPTLARGLVGQRKCREIFDFKTRPFDSRDCCSCEKGSEAEFLMERYSAFTGRGGLRRRFEIRHKPWQYCRVEIENWTDDLIRKRVPCLVGAQLVSAYYSAGAYDVEIGFPCWVPS